jgi:GT2 family glycosyltransferase
MRLKPTVSIITVNYKQVEVTCDLLDSIRRLPCRTIFEVIVVDNGAIEDRADRFHKHLPEAVVLTSKDNLGFAGGNNLGIQMARGEFLFFVNNDTVFTANLLDVLVEKMVTNPKIGAVSPKIRYFNTPQYIQYAGFTEVNPLTGRNDTIGKNERDEGQYDTARPTAYAHGAAMMVRREVVDKVGLMPENYFLYYEELDWCAQIRRAGFEIWYAPEGLIFHKESATVGKASPLKTYYLTRNRILFMRRNQSRWVFAFFGFYFFGVTVFKTLVTHLLKKEFVLLENFWKGVQDGFYQDLQFNCPICKRVFSISL